MIHFRTFLRKAGWASGFSLAIILLTLVLSCQREIDHTGYTLISKKFVKEVNADCYYFEHDKSGAKVFKIAADDPNKTFMIAFSTITDSDCGTPHITEHSVLEGSKNFPVKSPFDEMAKGSLRTFLNAMTGKDITMYPAASMNTKDYFNLMHVYFDAVFNPLVYEDSRIFKQEGWHYELTSPDGPIVYKGVVYNEMKGSFSSPVSEMNYQTYRHLFPDNCYRFSSGGYPEAIPELTYEHFLDYHRKYYHPSNCYILLYGDADLERELAFIDTAYLSSYDRAEMDIEIPLHKPFEKMREVVEPYSLPEGADTAGQTILRLSFVVGDGTDASLSMAMQLLQDLLVNQESAPLRLALQDAGIGKDITAYNNVLRQQVFSMTVKNADMEDRERFKETVFRTLGNVVDEGLDKEAIEGTINRMEFRLREGNTSQKGLVYGFQMESGWRYSGDPFQGLEYEKPLAEVKAALTSDYLERIIEERLINNPHALLIALVPEPGLENKINERTTEKLEKYKESLSSQEIEDLIKSTEQLIEAQDAEDSPEALATIPKLSLSDVNPEAQWYGVGEKDVAGQKLLLYEDFTNNIIYTDFMFDLRVVDQELLPYVSILREVLGKLDTEDHTYSELEKLKNIHTGGLSANLATYTDVKNYGPFVSKFSIDAKALNEKTDTLLGLVEEILLRTDYSDTARLRNLLDKHLANEEMNVIGNGMGYALTRLRSYIDPEGVFVEITDGMDYYWFLKELVADYDSRAGEVVRDLESISASLFTKQNMMIGLTCSRDDYGALEKKLTKFAGSFPEGSAELKEWELVPEVKDEGFMAASKVQYVIQGGNFKSLGYKFNGHMLVLENVMNSDWLHPQIRVKGGAYGGFGGIDPAGDVFFGSYRDPNLSETLDNYAGTPDFIESFDADSVEMTQYIIGTVADLDFPTTPSQRGNIAISNYFTGRTEAGQQRIRDEVLSTTPEDIRSLAPMISDIINQEIYCVYGNEQKIQANKALFHSIIKVME